MQTTALQSSTASQNGWLDPHPRLDGISLIDHLFNQMDGLFPHRWRSAFASEQAITNWREVWAKGLAEEGITLHEVKCGIEVCRRDFKWPPSFAEFMGACRPVIDPESAYFEAIEQLRYRERGEDKWSHRAIYWAASDIGSWDLRQSTWGSIKARWTAVLRDKLSDRELPDIPPPSIALPAPGQTMTSPESARLKLAAIRAKFKLPAIDETAADKVHGDIAAEVENAQLSGQDSRHASNRADSHTKQCAVDTIGNLCDLILSPDAISGVGGQGA